PEPRPVGSGCALLRSLSRFGLAMWPSRGGYLRPRWGGSPLGTKVRDRGGSVSRRLTLGAVAAIAVILALVAAGCGGSKKSSSTTSGGGGSSGGGSATALPASSCSPIYFEGSGKPQYIIASDLPL